MTLTSSIQSLWLSGFPLDWRKIYDGANTKFLRNIPHYPLASTEYVVPFKEPQLAGLQSEERKARSFSPFEFLASGTISIPGSSATAFITQMSQISRYIKAHSVGGVPLCPASVYMEVGLEALATLDQSNSSSCMKVFENLNFDRPLIYSEELQAGAAFDIRTEIDTDKHREFTVRTSSDDHQLHFSGRLSQSSPDSLSENMAVKQAYVKRQLLSFKQESSSFPLETLSSRTIYEVIFPRVVDYADPFLTLKKLTISSSGLEGYGSFQLMPSALDGRFICPPAFVDTLLHAAGFMANTSVTPDIACICTHVDRAVLPSGPPDTFKQEMRIYCSLLDIGHTVVADAYALNEKNDVVGFVEGMSFKKLQLKGFIAHLSRMTKSSNPAQAHTPATAALLASEETHSTTYTKKAPHPDETYNVEATVRTMLKEVCGINGEHASGSLDEMGVDSLLNIELAQAIQNRFPSAEVSKTGLENCSTVEELVETVNQGLKHPEFTPESVLPGLTRDNSPVSMTPGTATPSETSISPEIAEVAPELESLFKETCGLNLSDDEKKHPLITLGVDSLLSIELSHELRARFGLSVDEDQDSISSLTFRQLEDLYKKKLSPGPSVPSSPSLSPGKQQDQIDLATQTPPKTQNLQFPQPLQKQQSGASRPELFLFHDGSGLCSMYSKLKKLNLTVNGIFSLDAVSPDPAVNSMEDLAMAYIRAGNLSAKEEIILGGKSQNIMPSRIE